MVALLEDESPQLRPLRAQTYLGILLNSVGLLMLWGQPGWSHGAIATVTRTYTVEARYASGKPMAQAQVVVYSPDDPDQPWNTGMTNRAGLFEFSPDTDGNWEVIIRQAGHGTNVIVPVEAVETEITEVEPAAQELATTATPPTPVSQSEPLTSPLQRWASAGAGLWGLIGTVLFFSRGK